MFLILAAMVLLMEGCAREQVDMVTRTGSRELGDTAGTTGEVSKALTWIPVAERQPAPVASGPALSGKGTVSTADYPARWW